MVKRGSFENCKGKRVLDRVVYVKVLGWNEG